MLGIPLLVDIFIHSSYELTNLKSHFAITLKDIEQSDIASKLYLSLNRYGNDPYYLLKFQVNQPLLDSDFSTYNLDVSHNYIKDISKM